MTRLLTRDDIAGVLTPADCLQAVEDAFRGYGEGRAAAPKSLGFHAPSGTFHIKAAMADVLATKINANFSRESVTPSAADDPGRDRGDGLRARHNRGDS